MSFKSCLLSAAVGGTAAWCATVFAQPQPTPRPLPVSDGSELDVYSAFPELAPPPVEKLEKRNPGDPDPFLTLLSEVVAKPLPQDASVLRKIQHAQIKSGHRSLVRMRLRFDIGQYQPADVSDYARMLVTTVRAVADATDDPAEKARWREEEVRAFRVSERTIKTGTVTGAYPPHQLDFIQFWRLGAEADLVRAREAAGRK